ncbi:MAG: hypothetical protein AAF677_02040 [Pseudomonadota bacterium]
MRETMRQPTAGPAVVLGRFPPDGGLAELWCLDAAAMLCARGYAVTTLALASGEAAHTSAGFNTYAGLRALWRAMRAILRPRIVAVDLSAVMLKEPRTLRRAGLLVLQMLFLLALGLRSHQLWLSGGTPRGPRRAARLVARMMRMMGARVMPAPSQTTDDRVAAHLAEMAALLAIVPGLAERAVLAGALADAYRQDCSVAIQEPATGPPGHNGRDLPGLVSAAAVEKAPAVSLTALRGALVRRHCAVAQPCATAYRALENDPDWSVRRRPVPRWMVAHRAKRAVLGDLTAGDDVAAFRLVSWAEGEADVRDELAWLRQVRRRGLGLLAPPIQTPQEPTRALRLSAWWRALGSARGFAQPLCAPSPASDGTARRGEDTGAHVRLRAALAWCAASVCPAPTTDSALARPGERAELSDDALVVAALLLGHVAFSRVAGEIGDLLTNTADRGGTWHEEGEHRARAVSA